MRAATPRPSGSAATEGFRQMQASAAMTQLRAAQRRPAFVVTGLLLGLSLAIAVLANAAPGFMGTAVAGPFNMGLLLMIVQTVATMGAALWYGHHARTKVDPMAEPLRESIEEWESNR